MHTSNLVFVELVQHLSPYLCEKGKGFIGIKMEIEKSGIETQKKGIEIE